MKAASREGLSAGVEVGERARTLNIFSMVVTPEVSQLEMSALKLPSSWKRWLMSVMPETSQLLMGPYVSSAAVTSVLYSPTAVSSSALLAKVLSSRRGGGEGEGDGHAPR